VLFRSRAVPADLYTPNVSCPPVAPCVTFVLIEIIIHCPATTVLDAVENSAVVAVVHTAVDRKLSVA
jgi:hypothetical protein